jgi:hypothetical protein
MSARAVVTTLLVLTACGTGGGGQAVGHDTRVPAAAEIVGTYDVTKPEGGVGVIALGDELSVGLTHPAVELHGTLHPSDGVLELSGHTTSSDFLMPVTASGKIEVRDGVYRFMATLAGPTVDGIEVVMERPVGSDLSIAAGGYRFEFADGPSGCQCPSTIVFSAPIDASGSASLMEAADDVDAEGHVLASLPFAFLDLTPSGRFSFDAGYTLSDGFCLRGQCGPFQLSVDGILPSGSAAVATGRYTLFSAIRTVVTSGDVAIHHSE